MGGVRREGVHGEALGPGELGVDSSAWRGRSLLAGETGEIGAAALRISPVTNASCTAAGGSAAGSPPLVIRGDSGDFAPTGPVVLGGKAMARRVGGAGMRDGTAVAAAEGFFPLIVGSAGRTIAATRWTQSTTSAYSGRDSSSGRAFKSLSCATQASRSRVLKEIPGGMMPGDMLESGV